MARIACFLLAGVIAASAAGQVKYWTAVRIDDGPNELRLFDGPNLVETIEQYPGAAEDPIGFHDGASSPDGHIYFGWAGGVVRYDDDGTNPVVIIDGPPPGFPVWRALAFDTVGDDWRGSLWAASYDSAIIEVDLSGHVIHTLPNPGMGILALALGGPATGSRVWALTEGGYLALLNKSDGSISNTYPPVLPNIASWIGLSRVGGARRGLATIGDGDVVLSNSYGCPPLGPWGQSPAAYTGLAVVYEHCAGSVCGDVNGDGAVDAEDIDDFFSCLGGYCCGKWTPCLCGWCAAELNGDGNIDSEDIDPFFQAIGLGYCP